MRSLFLDNLPTKLMALGLAVIVWEFLDQQASQEITLTEVRLTVIAPQGVSILRVMDPDDETRRFDGAGGAYLRVTLRGSKSLLSGARRGLEGRHPLGPIQGLSPAEETRIRVSLQAGDFDLPRGIEVTRIFPSEVTIIAAQEAARQLRIADSIADCLTGSPPPGVEVERITFNPTHVRVRGLRHILDRLQTIQIVPVDVGDRHASFRQRVQIRPEVGDKPVTTDEPIEMAVTLRAKEEPRIVPDLPVELLFPEPYAGDRGRVRLAGPARVTAHVRGPAATVEAALERRGLRVVADLAAASPAPDAGGAVACPLRILFDPPDLAARLQVTIEPSSAAVELGP